MAKRTTKDTGTPAAEESVFGVRGVGPDGKAPKRRIATPSAMWQSYQQMLQYNCRRDVRFGDIEMIHMGMPPTPMRTNERNGQADLPNINTKQFQSKVRTYVETWTAINAMGDGYAEVKAYFPKDPMEEERRSKVLTEEFNTSIRLWDIEHEDDFESGNDYVLECAARDTQMGLYGLGVSYFRDSVDFRFSTIPTRKVLVPDKTKVTLKNCSALYIVDDISVTDLYGKIGEPGWNKEAILRNLYDHVEMMNKSAARQYSYAEWIEQIRENDSWLLNDFLPVRIIYGFVKEFDGTITQMAITDLYGTGQQLSKGPNSGNKEYEEGARNFLYERTNVATRWRQVLVPFADNAGPEGTWHGIKGFGDLIFDGCHLGNVQFNAAAKAGVMRNLMMFQAGTEADADKLDQVTFCPFGMLAPGLDLVEKQFEGDIDGALSVFGMNSQIMSENTRISPPNEKTVTNEQPTATQVTADRADRAQLTTLQIGIYRSVGQDPLFGEMYKRISAPAKDYPESWGGGMVAKRFRECCKKRGIPEADLRKVKLVRANRNVGSGDMALDIMKAKELLAVATPGMGQSNARKEMVAALKGVEMVPAFIEEKPQPSPEDRVISTENNLIQLGQVPMAMGSDDQQAHIIAHMQLLTQASTAAAQLQDQGIAPQELEGAKKLNNLLVAGIQHVAQHVALMAEVPRMGNTPALYEQAVQGLKKQLNNLQQISDSLGEDVAKAEQQAQPQMSPEMMKAHVDMQIKAAMAEQDMQLKAQAHEAKLGNLAVQTLARTEAKQQDHQLSQAAAVERTAQELQEKNLKAAQDLSISAAEADQNLAIKSVEAKEKPKKAK